MKRPLAFATAASCAFLTVACNSETTASPLDATADGTADVGTDATDGASVDSAAEASDAHVRDASANCVKPGTPSNEVGIGGYCVKGSDCPQDAGGFRVCTAQFGAAEDTWFCTGPCTSDPECGSGATCHHTAGGSGCVPLSCASPEDAGVDVVSDAPNDVTSQ